MVYGNIPGSVLRFGPSAVFEACWARVARNRPREPVLTLIRESFEYRLFQERRSIDPSHAGTDLAFLVGPVLMRAEGLVDISRAFHTRWGRGGRGSDLTP